MLGERHHNPRWVCQVYYIEIRGEKGNYKSISKYSNAPPQAGSYISIMPSLVDSQKGFRNKTFIKYYLAEHQKEHRM